MSAYGGSLEAINENIGSVVEQGDIKTLGEAVHMMSKQKFSSITCSRRAEMFLYKNECFKEYITLYNELIK